jgi:hypothetical protein
VEGAGYDSHVVARRVVFAAAGVLASAVLGGASARAAPDSRQGTPSPPKEPFTITFSSAGHRPVAGKPWRYTVKAFNGDGSPVVGTVVPSVLDGAHHHVDGVGSFGFKGTLTKTYTWNPEWRGQVLLFEVDIVANGGTKRLDFPVHLR